MKLTEEQIEGGEIGENAATAFFVAIAGLTLALMGGFAPSPGSLLYRTIGPEGADWATRAFGTLVALAGGIWFVRCMLRLSALKQRRDRSLPPFDPDER